MDDINKIAAILYKETRACNERKCDECLYNGVRNCKTKKMSVALYKAGARIGGEPNEMEIRV